MLAQSAAPALAALVAGWAAAALPFYPARWPLLLAALAAGLMAARARLGLAFTLAVPVFPLGNVSLGLALAYAGLAVAWLALMWGDPRRGLLFGSGIVLGPIGFLGLLPLAVLHVPRTVRRTAHALAAVLLAGVVAGIHGSSIPFSGQNGSRLGIAGSDHPIAVFESFWQWLLSNPALSIEALILAATAGALPLRDAQGRPLDRCVRSRAPGGNAARGPARRDGSARLDGLAHVLRSHGAVATAARARRRAAPFRHGSETDTCAFPR